MYGLNIERCEEFFAGKRSVPTIVIKNPVTNEVRTLAYKLINEIPSILEFLNEDMEYVARYRKVDVPTLIWKGSKLQQP